MEMLRCVQYARAHKTFYWATSLSCELSSQLGYAGKTQKPGLSGGIGQILCLSNFGGLSLPPPTRAGRKFHAVVVLHVALADAGKLAFQKLLF